jgi:acyl carrier protein
MEVTGLPASSITPEANLLRDLGLDSLDIVDLVLKIEDVFSIAIPDDDYPKLQTVGKIVEYVEHRLTVPA